MLCCCYSYSPFPILGNSEAVPQLLSLSEKLFHKMVDTREPFHLTLLNVCFSNLQAKSSSKSSIASFFTHKSPTTTQMTSQRQVSTCDFPCFRVISSDKTQKISAFLTIKYNKAFLHFSTKLMPRLSVFPKPSLNF